jgi:TolB-like protein/DNA-binding winged helix-turn-helix (wHTH) protein
LSARNGQVVYSPEREVISYEFDDFRLDVRKQELLKSGDPVALTNKAFQVLVVLAQRSKQTVEKETLYQELWADSFVEDANLTQHIYILRKTLGKDRFGESYIETVARVGYRFRADVIAGRESSVVLMPDRSEGDGPRSIVDHEPTVPIVKLRLASPEQNPRGTETEEQPPVSFRTYLNRKYFFLAAIAACMVLMVGSAAFFLWNRNSVIAEPPPVKSLAVLPLKPIGIESNNEKLGLGMADAIITRLSKLQQIQVRPTSSILSYTDRPAANSLTAAKEMGVDTILEGTIQRDEGRVRVSVQLIDASSGKALWADNFDENFTNIFLVQDSISDKVVHALEVSLTQQQEGLIADRSTTNAEAFQAYQMGVYFFGTRTKDSLLKAVDHFNKAIELDPDYAKAYAMLADTYNMLGYYRFVDPEEIRPKALAAVNRAFELNDSLPEAYIARASLQDSSEEGQASSKKLLEKAIELSPYNSTAHIRYGWMLFPDDVDGSLRQMRLAQEYDPLSPISNGALCNVLVFKNQYQEAIKYGEKAVELAPRSANVQMLLSTAYFLDGRPNDAIEQIKKGIAEASGVEKEQALGTLGHYYAKTGQRKEAETILAHLKRSAGERPVLLNDLALISYALDKRDEGFGYFKKAYYQHVLSGLMLRFDPVWKDVTSDARVTSLLEQKNG